MSRMRRNHKASSAWDRARQAAARLKPTAARAKLLARSTGAAARRRVHKTRAAPRVSTLLSSAAQRLKPARPRRRR